MKKIAYLFTFCFLLSVFCLNAQQTQVPDGSFEASWKMYNSPVNPPYEDFKTTYFNTLNSLYELEKDCNLTAYKEGSAKHGSYCIKLTSGQVAAGTSYVFLPGMVGTISEEFVKEFLDPNGEGVRITKMWEYDTPHAFEGWYKYKPEKGDSALIDIGFYNNDVPVYIGKKIIKETVNGWTKFFIEIPEKYWKEKFDDIRLLFVASAGVDFVHLDQCKGQLGSTLWIDNISLNYTWIPNGIKQNLFSTLKTNAFPNPATEVLHIELNENFNGKIAVYNLSGSLISEEDINGTQHILNTSALATGNYIFRLMKENTIFAQGKFVVTK